MFEGRKHDDCGCNDSDAKEKTVYVKDNTEINRLNDEINRLRRQVSDLQNRKPEGYIRKARVRIVFPLDRKEFFVQSYSPKVVNLGKIKEDVSAILNNASISFDVTEDDDIKFDLK